MEHTVYVVTWPGGGTDVSASLEEALFYQAGPHERHRQFVVTAGREMTPAEALAVDPVNGYWTDAALAVFYQAHPTAPRP